MLPISPRLAITLALGGCVMLGAATGWTLHGITQQQTPERAEIESVVHDYVLAHPEILPQAMENLRNQQNAEAIGPLRATLEKPWPGAVLGNPQGAITLVEFTDYACTYCRASLGDVDALIAANPDLKVVIRELPILTPASVDAARMALAAAAQGRYAAFRKAMFTTGRPDAGSIAAAARAAGLDIASARALIADPALTGELQHNLDLARQLGVTGTPAWVIGKLLLTGAVGGDALAKAVADTRKDR